jgi:hypothetical protein
MFRPKNTQQKMINFLYHYMEYLKIQIQIIIFWFLIGQVGMKKLIILFKKGK